MGRMVTSRAPGQAAASSTASAGMSIARASGSAVMTAPREHVADEIRGGGPPCRQVLRRPDALRRPVGLQYFARHAGLVHLVGAIHQTGRPGAPIHVLQRKIAGEAEGAV